jgi:hypothetical protein
MSRRIPGPGWPDLRGWAVLGFFGLTFFSLEMIRENPALLSVAAFMQYIGALATGGILLVAANLFGGTKAGTEAQARMTEALTPKAPDPSPKDPPP